LIYVLSQINAARGEDAIQVDEETSSEESEEEVCCPLSGIYGQAPDPLCMAQVEEFYSPGTLELLEARRRLAEYSLPRLDFCYPA
jgi:U4/U6 small nuclear ribonucleoprotein PRP4